MAKSLRSKSKRAFRAKKRTSTSSDYQKTEAERLERLSKRLTQPSTTNESGESSAAQDMEVDQTATNEASSSTTPAKVSTHGPRMSCREVWKASQRGVQLRRAPSTVVWHSRLAGKPHRRR